MKLSAVIFDFDGIIVDTEPLHFQAFQTVLKSHGKSIGWTEYCTEYIGFRDRDVFRNKLNGKAGESSPGQIQNLLAAKAAVFQELVGAGNVAVFPGVIELIGSLGNHIPLALCSGGTRGDILPILDQLGIREAFAAIVTADDTPVSKPDPAPYLLTLRKLGLAEPSSALAIEDTVAGITSARGAGLRVLAVSNSHGREHLRAADKVISSLEKISLPGLEKMIF